MIEMIEVFLFFKYIFNSVSMKYVLMHKDVPVADMDFSEDGDLLKTSNVQSADHMPYGTFKGGFLDGAQMKDWWKGRSIPASRTGLENLLEQLQLVDVEPLVIRSLGLSLSDHYWIKPSESELTWSDVNYFENDFSDDIGDILFGNSYIGGVFDYSSPDNTSDGVLKKRWKIIDGKRCLLKGGNLPYFQEPFNEVVASKIMDILDIPHVDYSLINNSGSIFSLCEDMVTKDTELISASRVCSKLKKSNNMNWFNHYLMVCGDQGLDLRADVEKMIVIDYIICNRDRHFNNFGIIRDSNTLQWISAAPIFDSGSSLGSNIATDMFDYGYFEECKPFAETFNDQIKYVTDYDWLDRESLKTIPSIIEDVFSDFNGWLLPERMALIRQLVESRIESLLNKIG